MPEVLTDIFATLNQLAGPALSEVMETTAFICPLQLPDEQPEQGNASRRVRLTMPFTGAATGAVEIVADSGVGVLLAANVLCADTASISTQASNDALLEFLNMVCGVLFRSAAERLSVRFEIGLPRWEPLDSVEQSRRSVATRLDVEGMTVAIVVAPE